jgi:hypothetical protein
MRQTGEAGGAAMFDAFSQRARRIVFFSRTLQDGASAFEVEHLTD